MIEDYEDLSREELISICKWRAEKLKEHEALVEKLVPAGHLAWSRKRKHVLEVIEEYFKIEKAEGRSSLCQHTKEYLYKMVSNAMKTTVEAHPELQVFAGSITKRLYGNIAKNEGFQKKFLQLMQADLADSSTESSKLG